MLTLTTFTYLYASKVSSYCSELVLLRVFATVYPWGRQNVMHELFTDMVLQLGKAVSAQIVFAL